MIIKIFMFLLIIKIKHFHLFVTNNGLETKKMLKFNRQTLKLQLGLQQYLGPQFQHVLGWIFVNWAFFAYYEK